MPKQIHDLSSKFFNIWQIIYFTQSLINFFLIHFLIHLIQVCLEGKVSKTSINEGLTRGRRAAGDLIPWTIAQQYQDEDFPSLSGARIVRIATHPNYHGVYILFQSIYNTFFLKVI